MQISYFLLSLIIFFHETIQLSFLPKEFKVEQYSSCPETPNLPIEFNGSITTHSQRNKFSVDGILNVTKDSTSLIMMYITIVRCDLSLTTCQNMETLTVSDICKRIGEKNRPWSKFIQKITPELKCPIKMNVYSLRNNSYDLSMVSQIPNVENKVYITNVKLIDNGGGNNNTDAGNSKTDRKISKNRKNKHRVLFCIASQVSITVIKNKRKLS